MKIMSIKTMIEVKNKQIKKAFHKSSETSYNSFLSKLFIKAKNSGLYSMDLTEHKFIAMVNDFNNNTK